MSTHDETLTATVQDLPVNADQITHDEVIFTPVSQSKLALIDILDGARKWPIWFMLAYQDIKLRYRRSVLGPFWLTISMAITVYSMGFLYAKLFHVQLDHYFPFLVSGMLGWTLISTIVIEFVDGLATSESLIKQIKLPYTLYIHRITCRNILIFFHNIFVIIPIMIIYHETAKVNLNTLLLLPGLAVIYLNCISFGMILALIGARYRDIAQIIKSLMQVVFFITPVMWGPEVLGASNHQWIIDFNPFYSFLELIREPLLGNIPTMKNLAMVGSMTIIGITISWLMFSRYRSRIIYWL
ncbi:MAG TPA: ABC transporter permease [Gammaproteobacteria bacterium]|jgi:ABC-type polysaccharide/polyol phosphate export permease|nr:ABC transporter permease [Gammaproteobacteria bacterium]